MVVIADDYSRYTWVYFLAHKHESFKAFEIFYKRVQNEKGLCISSIRSDHVTEFENVEFRSLREKNDIFHYSSSSRTPQQNGVVERKNITLQEMHMTMLYEKPLLEHLWKGEINTCRLLC